jgi:alkylation response protein AidB-like acyl-CoA dehydrogenase
VPVPDEEAFRAEVRGWLAASLAGDFAPLVGSGGPGREHEFVPERMAWERLLGASGWIGLGWPEADGGRGLPWGHEVIFYEEYARAGAPARVGHIGEQLLGPTLLMFGTADQRARFLPGILAGTELWCQGYSEPGAGSDLAAVSTRARLVKGDSEEGSGEGRGGGRGVGGGEWHLDGQKVWTSLAQFADWCFVLARSDPAAERHRGLSCLLVPMRQPGIEIRPIVQLTGTSEFNEVFFDDARAAAADIVGTPGDGWRVAMGTLAVERGVSTLGQQLGFQREFEAVLATARATGAIDDPDIGARIVEAWAGLEVMRYTALATLGRPAGAVPGTEANVNKLIWAQWHQRLGELAVDVSGAAATLAGPGYGLDNAQRLFLYTRADTIYGGSNEIQRNVIAERGLGLPREPR